MTKFNRLRKDALQAARQHGHKMELHWHDWGGWGGTERAEWTCKTCGAYVQVNVTPAPNGIDIGGTAVAQDCPIPDHCKR